ncbi:hypothetical protein [Enterobacter cloacae]|uniref:hypothetical protein n=1 Tax=Enterobacter cloacae TaxID=550 RepID=UPI0033522018
MTKSITEQLIFRPASEKPTEEIEGQEVLIFNPCDGWHEASVRVYRDEAEVYHIGFYPSMGEEFTPHDFYIFWALLPDWKPLREHFISEKRAFLLFRNHLIHQLT